MQTIQDLARAATEKRTDADDKPIEIVLPRSSANPLQIVLYEAKTKPQPTTTDSCAPPFPVDFVFTWVNGSNPELRANFTKYTNQFQMEANRYGDLGQLKYGLRAIELYAPWFNHVYIVTNGEKPSWLRESSRLTVISHWEIFKDKRALPVFNSNAIEMNLHRIPHVTDNFIYSNDDFTLLAPVCWSDFYSEAEGTKIYYMKNWGKIGHPNHCDDECRYWYYADGECQPKCNVVQCRWDGGDCEQHNVEARHKPAQYGHAIEFTNVIVSEAFGKRHRYYPAHVPLLLNKRTFDHVEKMFYAEVNQTSFHRTRALSDVQTQFLYVNTLAEQAKTDWVDAANFMHFIPTTNNLQATVSMFQALHKYPRKMVCINDNVNYEGDNATQVIDFIHHFYEQHFPNKSKFEM